MKKSLRFIAVLLSFLSLNLIVPGVKAEGILGDVDGDSIMTVADARLALRFAAGMQASTNEQKAAADMNADGKITLDDVILIMSDSLNIESYEEGLLRQGFPKSYVEDLVELHKKYPEWEFVPMITGLDWQKSVDGERSQHKKQLIESNVQASFKCSCNSCKGKVQEPPNWISASEEAVKYYMDPRNFLNEQEIFQFESTAYDSGHTQEGVESILKNTWMSNSTITYLNAFGNTKTYKEDGKEVKYSDVIMKAAEDNGLSAYYIASKIVQEVGSGSSSNAGGSSGKNAPFNGIYNYYNIGAYTGVRDGLEWANGFMKSAKNATLYKSADTSSSKVVTVPSNTELYYISASGDFYRVGTTVNGKDYRGYIRKSDASIYTSYGRPWTNPQKTIYYGAQYIYESFAETQYTGYLQKFNVNPESETLYGHEYMANVRAATFESRKTYNAYAEMGLLENKKVFSIPVFKNMPHADMTREEFFKASKPTVTVSEYTASSVTLNWTSLENAQSYQVYRYNKETDKYERLKTLSGTSYRDEAPGALPQYKVRAYYEKDGEKIYSSYSSVFYASVAPKKPTGLALASKSDDTVKIKWSGGSCTGYIVYRYDALSGSFEKIGSTTSASYTDSTVDSGTAYKYKIRAYVKTNSKTFYSEEYSSELSVTTDGTAATRKGYVSVSDVLNIRKSATTSSEIIAQLENGTALTILETSGDWYKVSFTLDGKKITGYGHKDYIKIGTYTPPKPDEPEEPKEPEKEKCPYGEPTVTVRQGDSGGNVRWVQWYLYKLGYLKESDIDGDFGPTTLGAVKKFQTDKNLEADGLVGSGTRGALKNAYGA